MTMPRVLAVLTMSELALDFFRVTGSLPRITGVGIDRPRSLLFVEARQGQTVSKSSGLLCVWGGVCVRTPYQNTIFWYSVPCVKKITRSRV